MQFVRRKGIEMSDPTPFSKHNPKLQLAWDASSLGSLMFCPKNYEYSILQGWGKGGADLVFGGLFASATEEYRRARLRGQGKQDATLSALRFTLGASGEWHHTEWDGNEAKDPEWVPWGGEWREQWHCTNPKPFKRPDGKRRKCSYALAGLWFPAPGPSVCGECGGEVEACTRWVPEDPVKNRNTLVRLVLWWCDNQAEEAGAAGVSPFAFPDDPAYGKYAGKEAVELSFRMSLPFTAKTGEAFMLCGYFDAIVSVLGDLYIGENKTTKRALGRGFFDGFSPHYQVDTYDMVAATQFPKLNLQGVFVDAAQVSQGGASFGAQICRRTWPLRKEWLEDIGVWIGLAEQFAERGHWPMNKRNCWLCEFKGICSMNPEVREAHLKENFKRREWNPLLDR
jgi:hypothetical protein